MADLEMFCGHCGETTGHTLLLGSNCVCAVCGENHQAKGVKQIRAGIEERKAEAVASLARTNRMNATPEAVTATVEPVRVSTQGEITMAKRLTAEEKADIIRRHEAGEANSVLAADFKVSENAIWYTCKKAGKSKVKRTKSPRASRQAVEPQGEQAGGLKAAIQAMVDVAVEAKLADLGYVKVDELDAKVADAMARALK